METGSGTETAFSLSDSNLGDMFEVELYTDPGKQQYDSASHSASSIYTRMHDTIELQIRVVALSRR